MCVSVCVCVSRAGENACTDRQLPYCAVNLPPIGLFVSGWRYTPPLAEGAELASFTVADPNCCGTYTLSLVGGRDVDKFRLCGAQLMRLCSAVAGLAGNELEVVVMVEDEYGERLNRTFTFSEGTATFTNTLLPRRPRGADVLLGSVGARAVNVAPRVVTLSPQTYRPRPLMANSFVGLLDTDDPNSNRRYMYEVVGGDNGALFNIANNQLRLNAALQTGNRLNVTVRAADVDEINHEAFTTFTIDEGAWCGAG